VTFLAVALAGGLGALARYLVDFWIVSSGITRVPLGTFTVNVTGSFALGLITVATAGGLLSAGVAAVLGAGFLGAYTTFSTWMYEAARLLQRGAYRAAVWTIFGSVVAGVAAAALGILCGRLLFG